MINDKKIEEAAKLNTDKYKWYPTLSDTGRCKVSRESFIDGAHWAIEEFLKDLWHDAKEEPENYKPLLCITEDLQVYPTTLLPSFDWKNMVHDIGIKRWLCIDDILPKQKGGEQ